MLRQGGQIYKNEHEGGIQGGLQPKTPDLGVLSKDQGRRSVGQQYQNPLTAGADNPIGVLQTEKMWTIQ